MTAAATARGGGAILIVDDDVDFADSLHDLLEPLGYEVRTAHSVGAAHAAVESCDIQMALLDIHLGSANGIELLSSIKAVRPGLVCVMMTALAETDTVIRALRHGAYDYLHKTFHPDQLLAVVDRCMERHRLERDRAEAHEALRLAKNAAEEASRAKSRFLAAMSHELRTPLNAIIGFSEIMMREMFGPLGHAHYRGYARDIRDSGEHLRDLINDILDLAKAEAGKLDLADEIVDVEELVASVLRVIRPQADAGGLVLRSRVPPGLPPILADPLRCRQILLNLLSNAVKFTPAGGTVGIGAGVGQDGIEISIADTGVGIAPADQARLFEPFTQVHDQRLSAAQEGTGLGLALTKTLVALHGGRITLASELGLGTTVTVILPRSRLLARSGTAA